MALIDEALIKVESGKGGDGCVSFRREKYVPRGGPNGGNGGNGGSVYLRATLDKSSLLDFKYQPVFRADRGQHGKGSDMDGRSGEDRVILVPVGTLVFDASGALIADLAEPDSAIRVARGGKGGKGNKHFATSTNRAPLTATAGETGETIELKLELRLLADVGLLGLPNAGKSTLLSVISRARPKIADYPFTTLEPYLGVVYHKDQSFIVADLPGLIEGASEGAGLGTKFLRHVSRNRVLLHLVDVSPDVRRIRKDISVIRRELSEFDPELTHRPEILVFTKTDLLSSVQLSRKKASLKRRGLMGYFVSSHTGSGLTELLDRLSKEVHCWNRSQRQQSASLIEPRSEVSL